MLENIILWLILAGCAFFVGRKFYRQWRAALDPKGNISCDCGCSGCGSSDNCDTKQNIAP